MTLKTALLAVTAVAALLGAAIIGVPSTLRRASEPPLPSASAIAPACRRDRADHRSAIGHLTTAAPFR